MDKPCNSAKHRFPTIPGRRFWLSGVGPGRPVASRGHGAGGRKASEAAGIPGPASGYRERRAWRSSLGLAPCRHVPQHAGSEEVPVAPGALCQAARQRPPRVSALEKLRELDQPPEPRACEASAHRDDQLGAVLCKEGPAPGFAGGLGLGEERDPSLGLETTLL